MIIPLKVPPSRFMLALQGFMLFAALLLYIAILTELYKAPEQVNVDLATTWYIHLRDALEK